MRTGPRDALTRLPGPCSHFAFRISYLLFSPVSPLHPSPVRRGEGVDLAADADGDRGVVEGPAELLAGGVEGPPEADEGEERPSPARERGPDQIAPRLGARLARLDLVAGLELSVILAGDRHRPSAVRWNGGLP